MSKNNTDYIFPNPFCVCVVGRSSKILLLRRGCCLCAWWVSRDLWQKQQNPASKERLLPLIMARFIGSSAEAAKSYFRGAIAAFAPGGFQWTSGGGSKILLLKARSLPLVLASFIPGSQRAPNRTKMTVTAQHKRLPHYCDSPILYSPKFYITHLLSRNQINPAA